MEVEEGGQSVGGWGELLAYTVVAVGWSGKLLLQLGEANFEEYLYVVGGKGSVFDKYVC